MTIMNLENIKTFLFAGNAIITISSLKTGQYYTFKVSANTDNEEMFFVNLLSGPDNGSDFTYLGIIIRGKGYKNTKASKLSLDSKPITAIRYLLWCITRGNLPAELEVRHEGKCGRCGRKLTTPESIDLGLGPVCLEKVGGKS